jgi:WD40 repeat protein
MFLVPSPYWSLILPLTLLSAWLLLIVTFSPDGKSLASGSWDNSIKLWNISLAK